MATKTKTSNYDQEVVTSKTVLPSDVDAVATKYGLTRGEAEEVLNTAGKDASDSTYEGLVNEIVTSRTINEQVWTQIPADAGLPQGFRKGEGGDEAVYPAPVEGELLTTQQVAEDEPPGGAEGDVDEPKAGSALAKDKEKK